MSSRPVRCSSTPARSGLTARGCELLHLGGGTSGADTLFAFKKSFGGETFRYAFATLVADKERYDALVARRSEESEPPRPGFFPAYRA